MERSPGLYAVTGAAEVLVIRQGRVVDPAAGFDAVADVVVRQGRIVGRGPGASQAYPDALSLDAREQIVCPGFVDLHTHLRFPGFPEKETIASGTAAAAAGGFTTVCSMANTNPVVDRVEVFRQVQEAVAREARVHVRQLAAVTRGLRGHEMTDLGALAATGAVAFSDDGKPIWNAEVMRDALEASEVLHKPISAHEEDPELVGDGVANSGDVARALDLPEWPCSGEASLAARDIALLEAYGGHLHIAHVSCAATVELIGEARARGLRLTAEVTPHHLRLTDRLLLGDPVRGIAPAHPCTKVNPPLRSPHDVEALVRALADGTIDAVATDHAPHTAADKALPYTAAAFGFSAIETALPLLLDLVRAGHIDLCTLVERLTAGPARVFDLEAGTLQPGAVADICIFDPDAVWRVEPEALRSKGKNTPLLSSELRGRVTCTVVAGRIVHGTAEFLGLARQPQDAYNAE